MESRKPFFLGCWKRQIQRARLASATPILSAEDCWMMNQGELGRLRGMIEAEGYRARIMVYLRQPQAWLSSMFQEMLKSGHHSFIDTLLIAPDSPSHWGQSLPWDYRKPLATLAETFGADRLVVRQFQRDKMHNGCVVSDFCRTLGIAITPKSIRRQNESLSIDGIRFLYAYNRFARQQHSLASWEFLLLLQRLQELPGSPLKLHNQLLHPIKSVLSDQQQVLFELYGMEFQENDSPSDRDAVCQERDMFQYSTASLEWLRSASGKAISGGSDLPEQVAASVAAIRPRLRDRLRAFYLGRIRQKRLRYANQ
jgi:hypothetical protein